jgi:hypothetical protein
VFGLESEPPEWAVRNGSRACSRKENLIYPEHENNTGTTGKDASARRFHKEEDAQRIHQAPILCAPSAPLRLIYLIVIVRVVSRLFLIAHYAKGWRLSGTTVYRIHSVALSPQVFR